MLVLLSAVCGALVTFHLSSNKKLDSVRVSSGSSLLFYIAVWWLCGAVEANLYGAVFFGGSFVGMSSPVRLSITGVVGASILFAGLFITVLPHLDGVGGALGVCAFVCVSIVSCLSYCFNYFFKRNS